MKQNEEEKVEEGGTGSKIIKNEQEGKRTKQNEEEKVEEGGTGSKIIKNEQEGKRTKQNEQEYKSYQVPEFEVSVMMMKTVEHRSTAVTWSESRIGN